MSESIKIAFASCSEDLVPALVRKMRELRPDLPLYVVSEFPVEDARWIPYYINRSSGENLARIRDAVAGKTVVFAGLVLQPRRPYWAMRFAPLRLWPLRAIVYNENFDHFMLRPRSIPTMLRHVRWRLRNFVHRQIHPGGELYTAIWRLGHPWAYHRPAAYLVARAAGLAAAILKKVLPAAAEPTLETGLPQGTTVVIPSRNGKELLARLLPSLLPQLDAASEVIVVDNGSDDGTAAFLRETHSQVLVEASPEPLSFAAAVNRGIRRARFGRLCLLNNDMVLEPGFFAALHAAFDKVPDLFASTAQILFPEGVRREETGKAVMPPPRQRKPTDFPVSCEPPFPGEDSSYVLYGSGGCTLYDTARLRALGGMNEAYAPAYVEDLDLGYRAWLRRWPTVFAAGALVLHLHRSTTSRYYTPEELTVVLDRNYLRFVASATARPATFRRLWREAVDRLNLQGAIVDPPPEPLRALDFGWRAPFWVNRPPPNPPDEESLLELTSGAVAVFPGKPRSGKPVILIAAPYAPFPLSHGGAVRMYNLMRRAAPDSDQVLICFTDDTNSPPPELLAICVEIVRIRRIGSHLHPISDRPTVVEDVDSRAFAAAMEQMILKWKPALAQLEFTQMAQYAPVCRGIKTLLVEHDITLDLYNQLLRTGAPDRELKRQHDLWVRFETDAWKRVDHVVTMSEKDRRMVTAGRPVAILNGVDLERFQPSPDEPEPGRILFLGSFAHLPNLMAVDFFLREVWQRLASGQPVLHIIAGARHRFYMERYKDRVKVDLSRPGIEVEDFVSDVRPAYRRAAVVVAPLVASAGTNIKVMEAMAMGKAIVSTPAGVNGLDELVSGRDLIVVQSGAEMAAAIDELTANPGRRVELEQRARRTAAELYDWDRIGEQQKRLYDGLIAERPAWKPAAALEGRTI